MSAKKSAKISEKFFKNHPKTKMKKLLFVNLIFLFSCSEKKSESLDNQAVTPNIYTLIFIDKTKSVNVSKPFVAHKYEQAINALVEQNVRRAGDKLEVYYIHENTAKSRCLSLTSRTEKDDTKGMNATDQEAAQTNYDLAIRKERNFFLQQTIFWQFPHYSFPLQSIAILLFPVWLKFSLLFLY